MNNTRKVKQLNSLQAIRGIAAILVLLHHTTFLASEKLNQHIFNGIFNPGNMGVDLFFVLSGFIIYFIHHKDIEKPQNYRVFLIKRFIRIYPIYWIVSLLLIPIYFVIPGIGESYTRNPWYLLKSLTLFPQENHPVVGVGWTLTHEVFFYLMFSLLIIAKRKYSKPIIVSWLFLSFVLFISSFFFSFQNYYINFIFSPLNLEFAMGSLCAYLTLKYKSKFKPLLSVGLILVVISWIFKVTTDINIHEVLAWGLPSALIILGSTSYEIDKKIKIPGFLMYLGDASYSIYLTHGFALLAGHYVFKYLNLYRFGSVSFLVLAVISLICGCVFHTIIEKRVLSFLRVRINMISKPIIKRAS